MDFYKKEDLKRKVIMKHYMTPSHKVDNFENDINTHEIHSQHCVDKMNFQIKLNKKNQVEYAKFQGEGCAIFLSSVDIFFDLIKNQNLEQVNKIIEEYNKLIEQKIDYSEFLNNLNIYHNVKTHLNRLECARLVATAVDKFIKLQE